MLRESVVLLLALAAPGMSIAEGDKTDPSANGIINVFPTCTGVPGNLVENCGFEKGVFSPWEQSGDTSYTDVSTVAAHTGTYGGRFGPVSDLGLISQTLSTIPGQLYNLSFWLSASGQPNRFQVYWGGVLISDSVNFPDTRSPGAGPSGQTYDQYALPTLPAPSGNTELKFGFYNVPFFFYLDDIVVLPVSGARSN